jgi:L-alanine-DL-glutamate epimerase-like enolase superfamily enzyme
VVRDGMATLTEAPGFGMDIDWREVERFRVAV